MCLHVPSFNPTLVRLRRRGRPAGGRLWRGFNPTLVRLRHGWMASRESRKKSGFQSHAGSIEARPGPHHRQVPWGGFNPTLVRLRRPWVRHLPDHQSMFQSHAGSIEARALGPSRICADVGFNPTLVRLRRWTASRASEKRCGFNPTLVRLRPAFAALGDALEAVVSIPRWFD